MWETHLRELAAWLVVLADNPLTSGSKGHAAYRLEQLLKSPAYSDLPRYIKEARKEAADAANQ
jgi:hypothetical protein